VLEPCGDARAIASTESSCCDRRDVSKCTTGGGPFAQFNVNFGVDTGGGTTATVTAGPTSPKMAA